MTDASLPVNRFTAGEFRVGRVLSRSMSVLGRNLLPFCLVTLIASLPNVLFFTPTPGQPTGASLGWKFFGWILGLVLSSLSQAIVVYGAFNDMRGRRVDLIESTRIGLRRIVAVVGVAIAVAFLCGFAFLALIVPGIIVFTMLFVATPACVVEELGPGASMRRSAELTKGHRWKIFGLWLLIILVVLVVVAIVGGIAGAVIAAGVPLGGVWVAELFQLIWGALWGAFYAIVVVVTYHDLRVAKEGVDTEQIAAVFD